MILANLIFIMPKILLAHSDAGIHTSEDLHDIKRFYNVPYQIDKDSSEYINQLKLEQYLFQDILLLVIIRQAYPNLANDRVLKILDFVKKESGLWDLKNQTMPNEKCPNVNNLVLTYIVKESEIQQILGLDYENAKALFDYYEITKSNPVVLASQSYHDDQRIRTIITSKLSLPWCYLYHHQNDLINAGIINIKVYINY